MGTPKVIMARRGGHRGHPPQSLSAALQRVSTGDYTKRVRGWALSIPVCSIETRTGEGGVPIKVGEDTIGAREWSQRTVKRPPEVP
jgi:hypothetical protein